MSEEGEFPFRYIIYIPWVSFDDSHVSPSSVSYSLSSVGTDSDVAVGRT